MSWRRSLAVVLLVVMIVTLARPARAEALEPTTIILIVSGAIVLVAVLVVLIIANVSDYQRRGRVENTEGRALILAGAVAVESP